MPVEVAATEVTATFSLEGIAQLTRLREASLSNKRVGDLNAAALDARNAEVNALIECARYQKQWMQIREEQLEQERRDHQTDIWWYRALIALGLVAANSL